MSKSRRDFLKSSSAAAFLAGSGSLLGACSHLDDWVMGEGRNESEKVVILGGGIAGLTAAYELKKNRIPFRLFEGSQRFGGRVWTLKGLNVSSQYADIGGEKIELDHATIQGLAKELKVPLAEVSPDPLFSWYQNGRWGAEMDQKKRTQKLAQLFFKVSNEAYGATPQILNFHSKDQFPKAVLLDQMSASQLFARLSTELDLSEKNFLEQIVRQEWGAEPSQISSLHIVHWMRDSVRANGGKSLRISGGASVLTQALFDRVAGVLPERVMKFGHRLTAVRRDDDGMRLIFQTSQGEIEVRARKVICALPANVFSKIDGWDQIEMPPAIKARLAQQALGTHSKIIVGFKERFWRTQAAVTKGGLMLTDLPSQNFSQAGVPQSEFLTSLHGVIQSQQGGVLGENAGLHSVPQLLKDLQKMDPKAVGFENIEHVQNWKKSSWAQGSRAYLKPGQFQLLNTVPLKADWVFAGDTAGGYSFGTLNGAVQSAIEAAKHFIKA